MLFRSRMRARRALGSVPEPAGTCSGAGYTAWRQLICSTLRLHGLVRNGKDGSRTCAGACPQPQCGAPHEDEAHLLGQCSATAHARRDFLAACGAPARHCQSLSWDDCASLLAFDSYGMSFHCPLDDAQFESAVLRFAAAAVSARFGNDRPSAGDVPDAAPVDAPARARPARLGPRARTVC